MGIADSIISAFLSHQFAKERQEQAQAAQEKQQKEQSQARLQQALMMKDIMGQQQEQRLQEQIAARKAQQEDSQAFRKDMMEKYKLTAGAAQQERIEHRADIVAQHKMDIEGRKLEFNRQTKIRGEEAKERGEEARLERFAPPGLYLDPDGKPITPLYTKEIQPGTIFYRQNSPQQNLFSASNLMVNHVERTLDNLETLSKESAPRFVQLFKNELQIYGNDKQVVTLRDLLGPATSLAIAGMYRQGGTGVRGGVLLAKMFEGGIANIEGGDTLEIVLNKIKTALNLDRASLLAHNMHPALIKESDALLAKVNILIQQGEKEAQAPIPSRRGRGRRQLPPGVVFEE